MRRSGGKTWIRCTRNNLTVHGVQKLSMKDPFVVHHLRLARGSVGGCEKGFLREQIGVCKNSCTLTINGWRLEFTVPGWQRERDEQARDHSRRSAHLCSSLCNSFRTVDTLPWLMHKNGKFRVVSMRLIHLGVK